jgi:hypothetical protein
MKPTVKPLRRSTVRETIVLETRKARVIDFARYSNRSMAWLARDVMSTPYAEVRT